MPTEVKTLHSDLVKDIQFYNASFNVVTLVVTTVIGIHDLKMPREMTL